MQFFVVNSKVNILFLVGYLHLAGSVHCPCEEQFNLVYVVDRNDFISKYQGLLLKLQVFLEPNVYCFSWRHFHFISFSHILFAFIVISEPGWVRTWITFLFLDIGHTKGDKGVWFKLIKWDSNIILFGDFLDFWLSKNDFLRFFMHR